MSDGWQDTKKKFSRIAAREGFRQIAEEVPAHFTTVYRLVKGEHEHPSRAVRAGIERIVEKHEQDKDQ